MENTWIRIFNHTTRCHTLSVYDNLTLSEDGKITLELTGLEENNCAGTQVCCKLSVADAKLVFFDILNRNFDEFLENSFVQTEAEFEARTLVLSLNRKYRQPYVLKIDNGLGESVGSTVKVIEVRNSLTLLFSEWEARKMAQTILDYIRDWETVNFRRRQDAMTMILEG